MPELKGAAKGRQTQTGNAIFGGGRIDQARLHGLIHTGQQYPRCRPYGRVACKTVLGGREGAILQKTPGELSPRSLGTIFSMSWSFCPAWVKSHKNGRRIAFSFCRNARPTKSRKLRNVPRVRLLRRNYPRGPLGQAAALKTAETADFRPLSSDARARSANPFLR
jgi:hypothetical protein